MIAWTAVFLLFFDCGFSLGFGEFFLPGCLIGIVLSLYIYCRKCFSSTEKRFSYLSVGLVLISCCYFIKKSSQAERRIPPPLQAAGGMRPCI